MSVLIISCNVFLDDLITETREELKKVFLFKHFEILETDLDTMVFYPFITVEEYQVENKESLALAQTQAYPDKYSTDVVIEMEKLRKADIFVFLIKPETLLLPTIFLGWIQRCFPIRFAVFSEEKLFNNKKFIFITGENSCSINQFEYLQKSVVHIFQLLELKLITSRIITSVEDRDDFLSSFQNLPL